MFDLVGLSILDLISQIQCILANCRFWTSEICRRRRNTLETLRIVLHVCGARPDFECAGRHVATEL